MNRVTYRLVRALGNRDLGRTIAFLSVVATALLYVALAEAARPGGGSSYSGGSRSSSRSSSSSGFSRSSGSSHSSSSSGSSGGGEAIGWLILMLFQHPTVGFPIIIIGIAFLIVRSKMRGVGTEWTAGLASAAAAAAAGAALRQQAAGASARKELEGLRRTDPAFSLVVFEDFVYFLYAEMHRARGAGAADALSTYLGADARNSLRGDGRVAEVTGIIIGSLSYGEVQVGSDGAARVEIDIDANYVERYRPQGEQRFFVRERLTLSRAAGARSRAPAKARTLDCPNCGAPLSSIRGNVCGHCRTQIDTGLKDWAIQSVEVLEKEPRGPLLTSSVEEQGTRLPTIIDPHARAVFAQVQAKDPQFSWQRLEQRVGLIFQEFHAGWVGRDPSKIRPFISDNLFQSQIYWIDLYRASRCINRTDGSHITGLELAAATTDAYYDAITVRLYATGLDYTISEDGKVLSGNPKKQRAYSEYWTLIRGAQKKPTNNGDKQCPNCGAPLTISMTGNCQYCGVKVTTGEYDWVLSRIEQDEAYTG